MRTTVGRLKRLINEEMGVNVERDPFPPKSSPVTLRDMGTAVLNAEKQLSSIPQMLGKMEDQTENTRAKAALKKAGGLAFHALNDLKALEAILTIAVKAMRKE